jgi:hypothetical protein
MALLCVQEVRVQLTLVANAELIKQHLLVLADGCELYKI